MAKRTRRSSAPRQRSSVPAAALFTVFMLIIAGCVAGIIWLSGDTPRGAAMAAAQTTAPADTGSTAPALTVPADTGAPTPDPTAPTDTEATPTASPAPTPATTPGPFDGYDMPYYLYLEKGSFTLTVYARGEDGSYTQAVKSFLVAIGKGAKTPTGVFTLSDRERWHSFGADQAYTQYAVRYEGRLFIHAPLYRREDVHSMYNNTYREIGTAVTAGCIRTATEAARWIYENCEEGTRLEIVNGSPRGTRAEPWPEIERIYNDPTDVEAG